jgi:hypothetical protein
MRDFCTKKKQIADTNLQIRPPVSIGTATTAPPTSLSTVKKFTSGQAGLKKQSPRLSKMSIFPVTLDTIWLLLWHVDESSYLSAPRPPGDPIGPWATEYPHKIQKITSRGCPHDDSACHGGVLNPSFAEARYKATSWAGLQNYKCDMTSSTSAVAASLRACRIIPARPSGCCCPCPFLA